MGFYANQATGTGSTQGGVLPNPQAGSYTLALTDANKAVEVNSSNASVVTIPASSNVNFTVGTVIEVCGTGSGSVTLLAATGVTLRAPIGTMVKAQYGTARLRLRATDDWVLSGSVAPFSDISGFSNLLYRLRASTVGVSTEEAAISSAPLEVGGLTLTQSTAASQPTWHASGSNNQPFITFDGVDDMIYTTSNMTGTSQPVTLAVIINLKSPNTEQQILWLNGVEMVITTSNSVTRWTAYAGSSITGGVIANGMHLFVIVYDSAASTALIYIDGSLTGRGNAGSNAIGTQFYLGGNPGGYRYSNIDLYEILIYSQRLSAANLITLHLYAQNVYATP